MASPPSRAERTVKMTGMSRARPAKFARQGEHACRVGETVEEVGAPFDQVRTLAGHALELCQDRIARPPDQRRADERLPAAADHPAPDLNRPGHPHPALPIMCTWTV